MNIEPITGTITDIFPAETYGNFEKRVFWLQEDKTQYPQTFALELWGEDIELTKDCKVGDLVSCKVDLRGKQWKKGERTGVINSLKCWHILKLNKGVKAAHGQVTQQAIKERNEAAHVEDNAGDADDLPF